MTCSLRKDSLQPLLQKQTTLGSQWLIATNIYFSLTSVCVAVDLLWVASTQLCLDGLRIQVWSRFFMYLRSGTEAEGAVTT